MSVFNRAYKRVCVCRKSVRERVCASESTVKMWCQINFRLCLNPSLLTQVDRCMLYAFLFDFLNVFSCLLWHLYCRASQQTSNWLQKGGNHAHGLELGIVLFGLSECFSKCFMMMTWRPVFATSWWFIGSLTQLFFFSAGGWVALRWIHQGSLLQPWKVWGELRRWLNCNCALSDTCH